MKIRDEIPDKIVLNVSGKKEGRTECSGAKRPSQFKPVTNKEMMKDIPFTFNTLIGKR